ncbi:hypothetical protein [Streptomyces sp. NPDC058045]|uniref:hypothetical protein n=1 Tax=Streptomyces sp. NPDC058045 TaxID=3346311 RepID=UPI0036E5E29D
MNLTHPKPEPIYTLLVEEHGDVVAEARQAAHQIEQKAREALDFSRLHVAVGRAGKQSESAPAG